MLGDRIRELRKARGWNRYELARRAGLSGPTISLIESGQRSRCYIDTAYQIASALDMTVDEMIGDPENLCISKRRLAEIRSLDIVLGSA